MPPSRVPETLTVPETATSPVLVGQVTPGVVPVGVGVGVGDAVRVGVGVGVVVPPPSVVTETSSKFAVENEVCRPIRPDEMSELVAEPIEEPLTEPLIELPLAVIDSVYQVPVETVRDELASTVTEPLLTACSCAWLP